MDELDVTPEFIEENKKLGQTIPKKNGGRYTKQEKQKRQDKVYKLHFDYGYSARKIAKLIQVSKNTINNDVSYWYSKIGENHNIFNPESAVINNLERLELQRSRLREQLDNATTFQEQLALEHLIYDIDCKILHTYQKLTDSVIRVWNFSAERLNDWMKEKKKPERFMTMFSKISVSEKAHKRIDEIIKEDRKRVGVT